MRLTIFGTGYVGLVTGACLADVGHEVTCVDVDQAKIDRLRIGDVPIYEPGLSALIDRAVKGGTLHFTTDAPSSVRGADVLFIAVGTPSDETGSADLQHVLAVATTIAEAAETSKIVVVKSTVPVGTGERVKARLQFMQRANKIEHEVVSNPEFLKEGSAISDFMRPDRIIVGAETEHAKKVMHEIYEPYIRNHDRTMYMDIKSAELTKYAANAMLATKISFINEIANLAERLGADIEHVRRGIGADQRIGYHFIYPGAGYGGSCFPKDVQALAQTAKRAGYDTPLLAAVETINARQKRVLFEKLTQELGDVRDRTVAVWGLAFKPNTDDIREAPSRTLIEALWEGGARVQAFDPVAAMEFRLAYPDRPNELVLSADKYAALEGADALVICTEWQLFRAPDFEEMALRLNRRLIVDGRNLYVPERMASIGWTYSSIGRQTTRPRTTGGTT